MYIHTYLLLTRFYAVIAKHESENSFTMFSVLYLLNLARLPSPTQLGSQPCLPLVSAFSKYTVVSSLTFCQTFNESSSCGLDRASMTLGKTNN